MQLPYMLAVRERHDPRLRPRAVDGRRVRCNLLGLTMRGTPHKRDGEEGETERERNKGEAVTREGTD